MRSLIRQGVGNQNSKREREEGQIIQTMFDIASRNNIASYLPRIMHNS